MERTTKRASTVGICFLAFAGILVQHHLRGAEDAVPGARRSPVAPREAEVRAVTDEAYAKFKSDTSGKNADYIPILAKVDPKLFGVAIVTTDNQEHRTRAYGLCRDGRDQEIAEHVGGAISGSVSLVLSAQTTAGPETPVKSTTEFLKAMDQLIEQNRWRIASTCLTRGLWPTA